MNLQNLGRVHCALIFINICVDFRIENNCKQEDVEVEFEEVYRLYSKRFDTYS